MAAPGRVPPPWTARRTPGWIEWWEVTGADGTIIVAGVCEADARLIAAAHEMALALEGDDLAESNKIAALRKMGVPS